MPRWVFSFDTRLLTDFGRRDGVLLAMDEQAGSGAGGEEREIVMLGQGRDRDEAGHLRPPHQQLHRDPGAEGHPDQPADAGLPIEGLQPVQGGGGIRQFAGTVLEQALAAADAAEIEPQHGKTALGEHVIERMDDGVVHGPAELRVGVQQQRNRGAGLLGLRVSTLDTPGGPTENHFRHVVVNLSLEAVATTSPAPRS